MITANHVINQEIINEEKVINVTINDEDEKGNKYINIDKTNRNIYTSEKYDMILQL